MDTGKAMFLILPGKAGTTSPDGWIDTPVGTFRPDLKKAGKQGNGCG